VSGNQKVKVEADEKKRLRNRESCGKGKYQIVIIL